MTDWLATALALSTSRTKLVRLIRFGGVRHRKALFSRRLLLSRPPRTKTGEARHLEGDSLFVGLSIVSRATIQSQYPLTASTGPVTSGSPGSTTPSSVASRAPPDLSGGYESSVTLNPMDVDTNRNFRIRINALKGSSGGGLKARRRRRRRQGT
jgi:hypothetical protein